MLERVALSPLFGWLFKSRVRAIVVHEHGLVVQRGSGGTFVEWTRIERILSGGLEPPTKSGTDLEVEDLTEIERATDDFYELEIVGGDRIRLDGGGARRIAHTIADRAGLEWFELESKRLPPMAVRPSVAASLRRSFRTWSE